jgi:two-component system cell cycle response regulator DivK
MRKISISNTIMIVEDNDLNILLFKEILETKGCNTIHIFDYRGVLRHVRETKPDLIFLGIRLPDILDTEIAFPPKSNVVLRRTPIITLTALAMPGDGQALLDFGCDRYISKFISPPHFLETVEHDPAPVNQFPWRRRTPAQLARPHSSFRYQWTSFFASEASRVYLRIRAD